MDKNKPVPWDAVPEIVEVLHKYRIPIQNIPRIFDMAMNNIKAHTIPYSPSLERAKDLASSSFKSNSRTRS